MKTKTISKGLLSLLIAFLFAGCSKSGDNNPAPATGKFSAANVSYSGSCTSVPDVGNGGALGNIDVLIATTSGANFIVYNMPKQSSGTYSFNDGYNNVDSSLLYGLCYLPVDANEMATSSGTVTKTGTNSFTFSCTVYDLNTNQSYIVTGRGSY